MGIQAGRVAWPCLTFLGVSPGWSAALESEPAWTVQAGAATVSADAAAPSMAAGGIGGDMTFCQLYGLTQLGREADIVGLSVATTSWNVGDADLMWFAIPDEEHPFIVMNLYRLKDDRFEQIGQSWVKHAFHALDLEQCGTPCTYEPGHASGDWLGVGCTDVYSASLNGTQNGLGPRYEVNPWTGAWTYAGSHLAQGPHPHDGIRHRLQVHDDDLDPAQNPGAEYFVEGYYAILDDVNVMNSASWKPVTVSGVPGGAWSFSMSGAGTAPDIGFAIDAWTGAQQTTIAQQVPPTEFVSPDGRCILAAKVTDLGGSVWHYEYALLNVDMDRQVGVFSVPLAAGAHVTNPGFHAVRHHDEPFNGAGAGAVPIDNAPWVWEVTSNAVSFSTGTNPLRWGTLYNFRFDADSGPEPVTATLGLFKPGTPSSLGGATTGPTGPPPVCGDGAVDGSEECDPPDGTTCDDTCLRIPICGDGFVDEPEMCDPPDGLHCDAECRWICGDGVVQEGEDCDPPDGVNCGADCLRLPVCGDGFLDPPGELCDDGNTNGGDGCDPSCQLEYSDDCGDAAPIAEGTYAFDTRTATTDGPAHAACEDDGQTYNDIWYQFIASCSGELTVSLCGSGYNTDLAVYDTCDCMPGDDDLLGCNDDGCPGGWPDSNRSRLTIGVVTGGCYLIRVGGWRAADGGLGTMTVTCEPSTQDAFRGGLLWDTWWLVNGSPSPAGTHPLYPPEGQQTGSTTFRCKECHGWDYQGADGAYGAGPHYTGIAGVYGSTMTAVEMFDIIKRDSVPNGHGYENYGLSDEDVLDLVEFLQTLLVDTDVYIDGNGAFTGDPVAGQLYYESEGPVTPRCTDCHGPLGTWINFGEPNDPEWVGTVAVENPWEMLHKVRFGAPGAIMPSWQASGGTTQQAADIGRYAQLTFPVNCTADGHCDDGDYCNGPEQCSDDTCLSGEPPGCGADCIDCNSNGVDDRCDPFGDSDLDGGVDLIEYQRCHECVTGVCPQPPCNPRLYADDCCVIFDVDQQGDVDLKDLAAFQLAFE